jgi:hypothetical protein
MSSQYPQGPTSGFQQPSPSLPYADPYVHSVVLPTSVKTIAIIGVCLGALTLLNHALGILLFLNLNNSPYGAEFVNYNIILSVVFGFMAVVCVTASGGCLMRMEWARQLFVFYSVAYPILLVISTIIMVGYVIPSVMAPKSSSIANGSAMIFGAYFGAIGALVICSILPVFAFIYLNKPTVKAVFASAPR